MKGLVWILVMLMGCNPSQHEEPKDNPLGRRATITVISLGTGHWMQERALMGTRFQIQVIATDERQASAAIEAAMREVARIELLTSEWIEDSEISKVNRAAGQSPVRVGPDLLAVVRRGLEISALTDGAFDMSFASCSHLWSIRQKQIPEANAIKDCLPRIDYRQIDVDLAASTIMLRQPHMRIGSGGIAKGYAVDAAADILQNHGIEHYFIDSSGDIRVQGRKPDGPWVINIPHPRGGLQEHYRSISLERGSVVTSGDYERYFLHEGTRYHHIIDPKTGQSAHRSIAVTVIAPRTMDADALSTGLFVMGAKDGLNLLKELPEVQVLFFEPDMNIVTSDGFPRY